MLGSLFSILAGAGYFVGKTLGDTAKRDAGEAYINAQDTTGNDSNISGTFHSAWMKMSSSDSVGLLDDMSPLPDVICQMELMLVWKKIGCWHCGKSH